MKIYYAIVSTLFFISFANAKNISCQEYEKEASNLKSSQKVLESNIKQVAKQIDSNKLALDNFNKNCRSGSKANCNPAMYQMITSQMPMLIGQRDQIQAKIGNLKMQEIDATKNYNSCKSVIKTAKNNSNKTAK